MSEEIRAVESTWIAAALLTYELVIRNENLGIGDIFLKQSNITKKATELRGVKVPATLVSSQCTHGIQGSVYNYFVTGEDEYEKYRRLSSPGEFNGIKEHPELNLGQEFETEYGPVTIEELYTFMENEYSSIVNGANITEYINIEAITDYLMKYSGLSYIKPNKAGSEADGMQELHDKGIEARKQFTNLAKIVALRYSEYEMGSCSGWVNQGQKVPDYLWIEFKQKNIENIPSSISLFAWKYEETVLFYLAVEARDSACKEEDFKRHNKVLNLEMSDDQLYYFVEKSNGEYFKSDLTRESLLQKVNKKELKKVRIQKDILKPYDKGNLKNIIKDIKVSFLLMEPYYREVVSGMSNEVKVGTKVGNNMNINAFGSNIILYGPPGTGKTYNTVNLAVSIIEKRPLVEIQIEAYTDILARYRNYMESGLIAFTTFHQSYGYEEFIEGIKPHLDYDESEEESKDLTYTVSSGVFKRFCNTASLVKVTDGDLGIGETPKVWNILLDGTGTSDLKKYCFEKNVIKIGWYEDPEIISKDTMGISESSKTMLLHFQEGMSIGDIVLIQKDKKHIDAIGIVTGEYEYINDFEHFPRTRDIKWIAKNIDHDVYDLNMQVLLDRNSIYPLRRMKVSDVIKLINKYSNNGSLNIEENENNYVFIIDEINRGNISKIFGELITLVENTKRIGAPEEAVAILPYSGEKFGVPKNVYVLGTMNTADRSIALMDTALRRRFNFLEMMPNSDVLKELGIGVIEGIDIVKMLDVINERIEYLYDREHTMGHAYFTSLTTTPTLRKLGEIFENAIIPLLQEYFYEDYGRIQLVLGDNAKADYQYKFILDQSIKPKDVFFGNVDVDLPEKQYKIQREAYYKKRSYIEIYSKSGE